MLTLYSQQDSGNCYKPRLLMAHLGRAFRLVDINTLDGSTQTPDFLAKNPIGKVPLLEFDDGRRLAESNAMLIRLSEDTRFLPADPFDRAKAYEWLFFEQNSHEPTVAVRRSELIYPERNARADTKRLAALLDRGHRALAVMEARLGRAEWLAGEAFSIADVALYAYTHVADEGGFDLSSYPGILRWLSGVSGLEGHRPIEWRPGQE